MKVMVNELQQQLNELEEQERLAELNSSKAAEEEPKAAAAAEADLLGKAQDSLLFSKIWPSFCGEIFNWAANLELNL